MKNVQAQDELQPHHPKGVNHLKGVYHPRGALLRSHPALGVLGK